jgi:hypothetical protein
MSATGRRNAMSETDDSVARMLFVDVGVRSLLAGEARRRAVTRVFGVPPEEQSLLVTLILLGAAGAVVRGRAPGRLPRPTRTHAAVGATVLNTTLRGIAGAPSATVPAAGGLIAFAVLSHSLRPTVVGAIHEARAFAHGIKEAFGARYRR